MVKPYQRLPLEELQKIIQCKSYEALSELLGAGKKPLLTKLPFHQHLVKDNFSFFESFYFAFSYAQMPIQLLWLTIAFASLGTVALFIFGGVFTLAGALLIGFSGYYANLQHEKILSDKKELALIGIQIEAFNELLRRKGFPVTDFCTPPINNVLVNKRESFEMGLMLTLGLAFTYWGTRDLVLYVGFMSAASLFAGPLGLAIVAGIAICVGISFGIYHHYHQKKNNPIQSLKIFLLSELKEKRTILKTLENKPNLEIKPSPFLTRDSGSIQADLVVRKVEDTSSRPRKTTEDKIPHYCFANVTKFNIFKNASPVATTQTKGDFPLTRSMSF